MLSPKNDNEPTKILKTQQEIDPFLLELMRVIINGILYIRAVYKGHLFEQQIIFNARAWICKHPVVEQYISSFISHIKPFLIENSLKSLIVVICENNHYYAPFETYTLTFKRLSHNFIIDEKTHGIPLEHLKHVLSLFISKLNIADSILRSIPSDLDVSFSLAIELENEIVFNNVENIIESNVESLPWIPEDKKLTAHFSESIFIPLKSFHSDFLELSLQVQQKSGVSDN